MDGLRRNEDLGSGKDPSSSQESEKTEHLTKDSQNVLEKQNSQNSTLKNKKQLENGQRTQRHSSKENAVSDKLAEDTAATRSRQAVAVPVLAATFARQTTRPHTSQTVLCSVCGAVRRWGMAMRKEGRTISPRRCKVSHHEPPRHTQQRGQNDRQHRPPGTEPGVARGGHPETVRWCLCFSFSLTAELRLSFHSRRVPVRAACDSGARSFPHVSSPGEEMVPLAVYHPPTPALSRPPPSLSCLCSAHSTCVEL